MFVFKNIQYNISKQLAFKKWDLYKRTVCDTEFETNPKIGFY